MPRWLAGLLALIFVAGLPPFLVLSSVFVFMSPEYLEFEYNKSDFPKATLFNDQDRRHFAIESIEYIRGNRTYEQFKGLGVYNDRELKHMLDVRILVDQVKTFWVIDGFLLFMIFFALVLDRSTRYLAARALLSGAILALALFGLIGLFADSAFDIFFVLFHRIFFEGDTWLFYYTDSLIQFYPERFWFDTSIGLVALTIIEALLVGGIGWWWGRSLGRRRPSFGSSRSLPET